MKRKSITTSKTGLADILNKMDGLRTGTTRAENRKMLKFLETLETALYVKGWKSACLIIRRNAVRKGKKIKNKKTK